MRFTRNALLLLLFLGFHPAFGKSCNQNELRLAIGSASVGLSVHRLLPTCPGGFPSSHATLDVAKSVSIPRFDQAPSQDRGASFRATNDFKGQNGPSIRLHVPPIAHTLPFVAAEAISNEVQPASPSASLPSVQVTAQIVPSGCKIPSASPPSHVFYVDPIHGEMKNDGSQNAPWRTLEEVVKAGLIATQHYASPYRPGAELLPQNPNGVVRPGDVIYLRNGNHGSIDLFGAVNRDFITIEAEHGQKPVLSNLSLAGSSKWVFRGLTIQNAKITLVEFLNHDFLGPTDNIIFEENQLWSLPDVNKWTQQDWVNQGADIGIYDQAACSTIRGNQLRNIRRGIILTGDDALVDRNVIDNFGDDAIDITASRITVRGNRITNSHDLGDGNHNDAIQGWTVDGKTNRDTLIDGNTIIVSTDPALPFPGYLQGISVFDGIWENIRVTNNIVVTNAWHGIGLFGIRGGTIINNTVIGVDRAVTTWIGVFNMKMDAGGSPPSEVIVRNNIASKYSLSVSGTIADHNVIATNPRSLFASFDIARAQYDLHILPNSRARRAGILELAPHSDIVGQARAFPVDAGAYVWTEAQLPR